MFWIVGGGASSGLADEDCHLRTAVLDCDVLVTRFVTRRNANERHCRDATEVGIIFLSTMQVANKVFPWAERVEESLKWWECGKPSQYFVIIVISFIFHQADGNVCTATEKPSNSHDALTWLSAQVRRKKKGKTQRQQKPTQQTTIAMLFLEKMRLRKASTLFLLLLIVMGMMNFSMASEVR